MGMQGWTWMKWWDSACASLQALQLINRVTQANVDAELLLEQEGGLIAC
jgi:hypothetical protein